MRRGMQTCPLCGQQFGSASIAIHVPQCHQKQLKRWESAPLKERGPKPMLPGQLPSIGGGYGGMGGGGELMGARKSAGGMPMSAGRSPSTGGFSSGFDNAPVGQRQPSVTSLGGRGQGSAGAGFAGRNTAGMKFMEDPGAAQYMGSMPRCRFCKRTFAGDRIAKHESVCVEGKGSRKAFNSKKQRLECFDAYELKAARSGGGRGTATGGRSATRTNWRQQHQEFINAIRSAKALGPMSKPGGGFMGGGGGGGGYGGGRTGGGGGGYPQQGRVAPQGSSRFSSGRMPASGGGRAQPFGGPTSSSRFDDVQVAVPSRAPRGGGAGNFSAPSAGYSSGQRGPLQSGLAPPRATPQGRAPAQPRMPSSGGGRSSGGSGGPSYQILHTNATSQGVKDVFGWR